MEKLKDWNEIQTKNNYEKLELGGHICKILEVSTQKYTTKSTGEEFEQLILKIDIVEPDKQAGYYKRRLDQDRQGENGEKAKWKGYYKLTIPKDSSPEYIKSAFKTLVTSIEQSNSGYQWNWEENTFVGKVFVGVFGLEEFELPTDGKIITFARCRFVRSTKNNIELIPIPKVKLLNGEYVSYDDYMENKQNELQNKLPDNNNNVTSTLDDDLPF